MKKIPEGEFIRQGLIETLGEEIGEYLAPKKAFIDGKRITDIIGNSAKKIVVLHLDDGTTKIIDCPKLFDYEETRNAQSFLYVICTLTGSAYWDLDRPTITFPVTGHRFSLNYNNITDFNFTIRVKDFDFYKTLSLENFNLAKETVNTLIKIMDTPHNIIISGKMNVGKTVFTNLVLSYIPHQEIIYLVEDNAKEIDLGEQKASVRDALITPKSNIHSITDSILKSSCTRLIIGEFTALNSGILSKYLPSGNGGLLMTLHSESAQEIMKACQTRMSPEDKNSMSPEDLLSNMDMAIQLDKSKEHGFHVKEISLPKHNKLFQLTSFEEQEKFNEFVKDNNIKIKKIN